MKQKAKRGAKGMRYSLFVSVLIILNVVCQSSDILPTQSQEIHLETLQELDNELKEEENIVNESSDELDESTDPQEIVEETLEEIEILKFNINGLKLREGIISEDVLRLKEFLKAMGYEGIIEDYKYDQKTKEIVMDYQRANGLVPDGVVGEKTFTKINEDMEINKIFIPEKKIIFSMDEDQVNEEIPEGNFIIINKDSNTLYHLSNREIIDKYPVATGKELKYTPEGKFTIVTKFVNPAWGGAGRHKPIKGGDPNNPLGTRWMGLNIRGGGVYGIHGNSDENSIGRYVSLGCVRMFNEDVEALYDLIDYGTPVWIGTEEKLGEYGIRFIYE